MREEGAPRDRDFICLDCGSQLEGKMLPCFFDLSIDMLCVSGKDGYFKTLNGAWEKALGYTNAELCAQPYLDFVHPEDRELTRKHVRELVAGRSAPVFENRYRCRDGSYRWLSWSSRPVPGRGLIYAVVRDITAQKQAELELRMVNAQLKAANEQLATMNAQHIVSNRQLMAAQEELKQRVEALECSRRALDAANRELVAANQQCAAMNQQLQAANEQCAAMNQEQMAMNEELVAAEEELRRQVIELRLSRQALREANRELRDTIDFLPDPTFVIDRDGTVTAWNKAMEAMTGIGKEQIIGRADGAHARAIWGERRPLLADAILSEQPGIIDLFEKFEREGDTLYGEVFVPRLYGGRGAHVWMKAAPLYNQNGDITGAIESVRDVTELRRHINKLRYLNMYDRLTGLYNRFYFEREMQRLRQHRHPAVGIILCDVDGLKLINDSLGHEAGDKLLVAAADLIRGAFRRTDLVARVGGDEFGLLLTDYDREAIEAGARRIRQAVLRYNIRKPGIPLSISVGYAVSVAGEPDVRALFREADNNLHRAKLHQVRSARSATVQTLMKALEARDFITEGHADRIQELLARIGEELGLPSQTVVDLRLLAQFHDIGKVGIPDSILFKPGPLTPAEMKEMKRHSEIGYRIALSAPDLLPIADWILHHHEWWDGRGYPMGLKGEAIPLACRILALTDAYDAMTNDRPYRKAMSHAEAVAELRRCAGTQFDPGLTWRFIRILEDMDKQGR